MDWNKLGVSRALEKVDKPPADSFTAAEYASQFGFGHSKARDDLTRMVAAGKLKKTVVKVENYIVPYYTLVESKVEADNGPGRRRGNRGRRNGRRTVLRTG